jgi:hypothetical protein
MVTPGTPGRPVQAVTNYPYVTHRGTASRSGSSSGSAASACTAGSTGVPSSACGVDTYEEIFGDRYGTGHKVPFDEIVTGCGRS